jgi:hypothetical protein
MGTLGLGDGLALGSPPPIALSSFEKSNGVPYEIKACEVKWLRTNIS